MRAEDLAARRMIESGVTVRQITTSDLFRLHPEDDVDWARKELESRDLDQAPLAESPIHRCVRLDNIRGVSGVVASFARPIRVDEVVAGATGLAGLLPRFADRDHFYVLDGDGIEGIVTRADLQLPPVSMAVLGIVISLEMAMTELIATYSHGSWIDLLQVGRRKKLLDRFEKAKRSNAEITELECLDLIDRFHLVGRMPELGAALGLPSPNKTDKVRKRVEKLRNPLAHASSVITAHDDFAQVLAIIAEVRGLAELAWSLVVESPFVWDAYASTEIVSVDLAGAAVLSDATGGACHVITAHNPDGRHLPESANRRANGRLHAHLQEVATCIEEVDCGSPSGSWVERSFAVTGLSRAEAVDAARRFGQRAIFEIEGNVLRVISCKSGSIERERQRQGA